MNIEIYARIDHIFTGCQKMTADQKKDCGSRPELSQKMTPLSPPPNEADIDFFDIAAQDEEKAPMSMIQEISGDI